MKLAALLSAIALLFLMVRGKVGVGLWAKCLTVNQLRLLASDQLDDFFKKYLKAVARLMDKRGLTA